MSETELTDTAHGNGGKVAANHHQGSDPSDDDHYGRVQQQLQDVVDRNRRRSTIFKNLGRLLVVAVFVGSWALVVDQWVDEFWLSNPIAVGQRVWEWLIDGTIWRHFTYTMQAMVLGYIIGSSSGIALGFAFGTSKLLGEIFEPFVLVIYSIPKIAVAPLFILWFGIGVASKVAIAAIIVFFLVFYNTFAGVRQVPPDLLDGVRILGGNRWEVMRHVVLPSASQHIYTGLSMAVPYSLIGAIVGELIAANRGLGYLLRFSAGTFDTTGTFAALVVLAVVGVTVNGAVRWHQNRTSKWMDTSRESAGNTAL